jgi:hypothetical protein
MNKIRYSTLKEPDLWMNFEKKNKNPPTYRPIGEMEGRVWKTNIFLRVALSYDNKYVDI